MWKRISFGEVAENSFTGTLTRPKLTEPLQMGRGMREPPIVERPRMGARGDCLSFVRARGPLPPRRRACDAEAPRAIAAPPSSPSSRLEARRSGDPRRPPELHRAHALRRPSLRRGGGARGWR